MIERGNVLRGLKAFNDGSARFVELLGYGFIVTIILDFMGFFSGLNAYIGFVISGLEIFAFVFIVTYILLKMFFTRNPIQSDLGDLAKPQNIHQVKNWLRGLDLPKFSSLDDDAYSFADTDELMETASRMNYQAFQKSQFGFDASKMLWRNKTLAVQNNKLIMLMRDPEQRDRFFGFSYIIPLNKLATRLYLEGKISDTDISPDCLPPSGDLPESLMVFAIALEQDYRLNKDIDNEKYLMLLVQGVMEHTLILCGGAFKNLPVLYAQTESRGITKLLTSYGFKKIGQTSADGCEILRMYPDSAEFLFA